MNKLMIKLIKLYKEARKNDGKAYCRYVPSCSSYALECYQKFNFFKASFLSITRILRCNPLFKGGYDPVPLTKKEKELIKNSLEEIFNSSFNPTTNIFNSI